MRTSNLTESALHLPLLPAGLRYTPSWPQTPDPCCDPFSPAPHLLTCFPFSTTNAEKKSELAFPGQNQNLAREHGPSGKSPPSQAERRPVRRRLCVSRDALPAPDRSWGA
uniref:Uncharacterized protein n=1 Tax=Eutreptiella gymnastica TaxID=73025 RepID=A0A7S1I2U9_9EUGL